MNEITNWLDKNGLVKARLAWTNSGNGVLYSCIWLILERLNRIPITSVGKLQASVHACLNGGNLLRTPDNQFGQEEWDDHLGLGAYSYFYKINFIPRKVLWYAIKNFGVLNTDRNLQATDFLGRFPQIWVVYLIAAFPVVKWIFYPTAWAISKFMKPDVTDASGLQLTWLYLYVMVDAFGFGFHGKYQDVLTKLKLVIPSYYDDEMPIVSMLELMLPI